MATLEEQALGRIAPNIARFQFAKGGAPIGAAATRGLVEAGLEEETQRATELAKITEVQRQTEETERANVEREKIERERLAQQQEQFEESQDKPGGIIGDVIGTITKIFAS